MLRYCFVRLWIIVCGISFVLLNPFRFSSAQDERLATTPAFTSPDNSARFTRGDTPPVIRWTEIADADSYELECSLDPFFAAPFSLFPETSHLDLGVMIDQLTWDPLSFQLFFHVRGLKSLQPITPYSVTLEFAKSVVGPVTLLTPIDDMRFGTENNLPVFSWEPLQGITEYAVEFSQDPLFENSLGAFVWPGTEIDCRTTGDRSVWDAIVGTFYWRVWGMEGNSVPTPFSAISVFSKTIVNPPNPLSPPDQTRFSSSAAMPIFTWEPSSHLPDEYHIQFAGGPDSFSPGGAYIPIPSTSFDFRSVGITPEMWNQFFGKLSWRISANDRDGNHGVFGRSFSFVKIASNNYMAFGDSITGGYGASNWGSGYAGYPPVLQSFLRQRYGSGVAVRCVENRSWFPGGHTYTGDENANSAMESLGPAHVLIMFGIIDIVDPGAPGCEDYDCQTIEHLGSIIQTIRSYHAVPYLATVTPVNPESDRAFLQETIDELNTEILALASEQSIALADMDDAFRTAPLPLEDYYTYDSETQEVDWAHFNDLGYHLIAETWNEIL
ncbi:SGNH/GDSL hydrolase family protein [bacterium]|nr:SGNH/GDSL hydrolase family protein [candidate division CSSED10-310 bacterium]